jgi:hypothetical protein
MDDAPSLCSVNYLYRLTRTKPQNARVGVEAAVSAAKFQQCHPLPTDRIDQMVLTPKELTHPESFRGWKTKPMSKIGRGSVPENFKPKNQQPMN